MPGLAVAVLLGFLLLLVYYSLRARPLPKPYPLNVDNGLPLPELAQSSTVFSLTALFGAYFGIAATLGLPALMGLAFGTVLGLFLVKYWIDHTLAQITVRGGKKFEHFLSAILKANKKNITVYALMIAGVQCVYATSELLIFRELTSVAFGLSSGEATLLAIAVAIMGYFYMLGGYLALFRTDMVQLLLLGLMTLVSGGVLLFRYSQVGLGSKLWPRPGFWEMPLLGSGLWLYIYHFIIAAVMGLGLLLSSPDTWKRVFQVSKKKRGSVSRVLTFVGVGALPYMVLLPFAITISLNAAGPAQKGVIPSLSSNSVFVAIALALIASFLSAFNSALLASVHVGLMLERKKVKLKSKKAKGGLEEARFYWLMVTALFFICSIFVAASAMFSNPRLFGYNNPWLLGNLLMGAYAIIAGVQIGTRGDVSRLPENSLIGIFAAGMIGWFIYFVSSPGFSKTPTINSVNTVPAGVGICAAIALLSKLLIFGGQYAQGHHRRDNKPS